MYTENEKKLAEKKFKADLASRKKQIRAIEKDAYNRRLAFVRNMDADAAKPYINHVALFMAKWHDVVSEQAAIKTLETMLNLNRFYARGIFKNEYLNNPAYAILANAASTYVKDAYHWAWQDQFRHISAEDLCNGPAYHDDLYEILIAMGYEMTDEERMWRDGTHPAYTQKTIEDFLS